MKRIFTLMVFCTLALFNANAQLADGTIVPNFTGTDLNGNVWNLYDILDEGKSVVIDVSATWCGPCWSYHTTGALESLYESYGPDGTNEMMVLMIEGDEDTNVDCLYDLAGCNSSTQGDWVTGTKYPIIDDASISELLEVTYFPTIYHVCPNRIVTELQQIPASEIYPFNANCKVAFGNNNASILNYTGFSGSFCQSKTIFPEVNFQNLGTSELNSFNAELSINGVVIETKAWTGNLNTYGIDKIAFNEITVNEDSNIKVAFTDVNNAADDDSSDNSVEATVNLSTVVSGTNIVNMELLTDNFGFETYWEILDENGNALYTGGNDLVVGGLNNANAYASNTLYNFELVLPADNCYQLIVHDSYGDGICCVEGNGYYILKDNTGKEMVSGGNFTEIDEIPFILEGAGVINSNASIVFSNSENTTFCGIFQYSPTITFQNLGDKTITSMTLETTDDNGVLGSQTWTGSVATGDYGFIEMSPISVDKSSKITTTILEVNGEADIYNYKNSTFVIVNRNQTDKTTLELTLTTDSYAYELYWEFTNSDGEVFAYGGNEIVGPNGGGTGGANPNDAGAYSTNAIITQTIELPEDVIDCYNFKLVDNYGDGMVDGGGGSFVLVDEDGNEILNQDLTTIPFSTLDNTVDVNPIIISTKDINYIQKFNVYPNPAIDELVIEFSVEQSADLEIKIINTLGQSVKNIVSSKYAIGDQKITTNIQDIQAGLYFIEMTDGKNKKIKKFSVIK